MALFSGGLDSLLAIKLMLEQGIEVHALNFVLPFTKADSEDQSCSDAIKGIKILGNIPFKQQRHGDDFLEMIRGARYGYGKGINPCIDCRIFSIKKGAEYMEEIGASFVFTGEVLGQRPMSQHSRALGIVERDSTIPGLILRPLSAHLLEPTIPEKNGWVDRERLLSFCGRNRKPQIALAKELGISAFPSPAGGCILTHSSFGTRLKDYFSHIDNPKSADMPLLRIARHFRTETGEKIIVARDGVESERLSKLATPEDHLLEPQGFSAPAVVLQGDNVKMALEMMLQFTNKDVPKGSLVVHSFRGSKESVPVHHEGIDQALEMVRL